MTFWRKKITILEVSGLISRFFSAVEQKSISEDSFDSLLGQF